MDSSELYIIGRLLENQILLEKKHPEIYESEIMTPPWNTQELKDLYNKVRNQLLSNKDNIGYSLSEL